MSLRGGHRFAMYDEAISSDSLSGFKDFLPRRTLMVANDFKQKEFLCGIRCTQRRALA
jgi:hypothetical protein